MMLLVLLLCCLSKLQAQITRTKPQMQPKELQLKYINECCRSSIRSDEILLHKCTNASAEQSLLDGWMEPSSTKNKRIALVSHATKEILGYASFTFAINQVYSEHNNYLFRMADPKTTNYEPRDARWNKVMILDKALQTWAKESDYIVWLDADLIVLDMSMKIEKIVAESPHGEVWVCASLELATNSNLMNSGFMILKNSEFVRTWLLPLWWTLDSRVDFNDQEIFDRIYMKYKTSKQLDKRVVVLEPDALNSDPPAGMKQKPQNQVLHLMGDHLSIRRKAFSSAFLEICRTVSYDSNEADADADNDSEDDEEDDEKDDDDKVKKKSTILKQQLGLDQKTLLAITLIEYKKEMETNVRSFQSRLESPISAINKGYNDFNEISGTNSALRRYSEGLDPLEKAWSKKEIMALQSGQWTSLDDHLMDNQGAILELYPEFFDENNLSMNSATDTKKKTIMNQKKVSLIGAHPKTTEELGRIGFDLFMRNLRAYERIRKGNIDKHEKAMLIFNALDAGSAVVKRRTLKYLSGPASQQQSESAGADADMKGVMSESIEIMSSLLELADELLTLEPKEKRAYIYHIRSDLYADLGYVQKVLGQDELSVENIRQALEEKEQEAKYAGEHCLAKSLMMLADRLCQLKRFEESLPYFDRAIRLQEAHLGPLHIGLGRFTSIAGQAYASTGQYKKAKDLIKSAIKIFESNPDEKQEFENDLPRARWLYNYCEEKLGSSGNTVIDNDDDDDDDDDDNNKFSSKNNKGKKSKSSKHRKSKSRNDEL